MYAYSHYNGMNGIHTKTQRKLWPIYDVNLSCSEKHQWPFYANKIETKYAYTYVPNE